MERHARADPGIAGPTSTALNAPVAAACDPAHELSLKLAERTFELERVVRLARDSLQFDAIAVFELTASGALCRALAGDAAAFGISLDQSWEAPTRSVAEALASPCATVIPDLAAADQISQAHSPAHGSFIAVPLWFTDGRVRGSLCGINRARDPELAWRDTRFLSMLGELVADDLKARRHNQRLRHALVELIDAERVDVAYQPVFDRGGVCIGVEALARFPPPFIRPDQTFAVAESLGVDLELEELVVRRAWDVQTRLLRGQFLALNLSPKALLALAPRARQRAEIDLSSLVVEITEHQVIDAYSDLRDELAALRARGLRIAVDDAGAGYASMRHVLELRPDIVKIDKWLIDGISADCARRSAVASFVALARELGATVIAEGVERPADLAAAHALGVDGAQGYLLGGPTTDPAHLAAWLAPHSRGRRLVDYARRRPLSSRRKLPLARHDVSSRPAA